VFGAVTMVSGMLGVPLGMMLSTVLREKYPRSDPLICGIGLVLSSLFIFIAFFFSRVDVLMGFALVFIGEVALNLNWSIVADILLVRYFVLVKMLTWFNVCDSISFQFFSCFCPSKYFS